MSQTPPDLGITQADIDALAKRPYGDTWASYEQLDTRLPYHKPMTQTHIGTRIKEIVEDGYDLKLNDYQCYDEAFRKVLNQRIVEHFWMREIGAETVELFVFYLNRTMREIMPLYDPIFQKLADPNFDPFSTVDVTTTNNANAESHGTSQTSSTDKASSNTTAQANNVNSNAPGVRLSQPAASQDQFWNTGAFNGSTADSTSNDDASALGKSDDTSLANYINHVKGFSGVPGFALLKAWLDNYVYPLNSLFSELEPCFSQIWN